MSTGGIHYDNFELLFFKEIHTFFSDLDRISLFFVAEKRALDLSSIHLKLFEGTSTECVRAHEADSPPLLHVMICELGACRGLAGALQPHEHHHVGFPLLVLIGRVLTVEHVSQLVHHRLLYHFPYVYTFSAPVVVHVLRYLSLDLILEPFHEFDVDVSREKGGCDVVQNVKQYFLVNNRDCV